MSYDIAFKVKVEGIDKYVEAGHCDANTTWNDFSKYDGKDLVDVTTFWIE
jgi:hypothetical protein